MSASYSDVKIHGNVIQAQLGYWTYHVAFTFNWWLLVILCVICWAAWWKIVDRQHIREIVMYGAFVLIVTTIIDGVGNVSISVREPLS